MPVFLRLLFVLALSVPALALAAYSAVNPGLATLPQNERPKKILLLPPQMVVAELSGMAAGSKAALRPAITSAAVRP